VRTTAAAAALLALLLGVLAGCGYGDRSPGSGSSPTASAESEGAVDPADLAAAMLLNAYDVGAATGATTRLTAHLDDVSACAVSSGGEAIRIAAVARTWRPRGGGEISQVLATFPAGKAAKVFTSLASDKAGRTCVTPARGFRRELGQPVAGVVPANQSSWCYIVLADKGRGHVCTSYVRRGDAITGVEVLGTDARSVKMTTAALASIAYTRLVPSA
jgi:hypothetical protein